MNFSVLFIQTEMRFYFNTIVIDILSFTHYLEFDRPDGQKKAYVRLTQDYDALDVANRIGII
jgi:hypothetical protein